MKNKIVGMIIISVAVLMAFITLSFNRALTAIVNESCTHGPTCPMWGDINVQTRVSIGLTVFVGLIGLYLILFGQDDKIIRETNTIRQVKTIKFIEKKKDYSAAIRGLDGNDKAVFEMLVANKGQLLQSEIVARSGLHKVYITRILDRLEGKGLVERRRKGMTNLVTIREN